MVSKNISRYRRALVAAAFVLFFSLRFSEPAQEDREGEPPPPDCSHITADWQTHVTELVAENHLDAAASLLHRVTECAPDVPEPWWRLGTVQYDRGEYAAAARAFAELTRRLPAYGPAYVFLGMAELAQGDAAAALGHLRQGRALGTGGDQQVAYLAVLHEAKALLRLGRFTDAYPLLRQLMNSRPEDPYIQELVGAALLNSESWPEDLKPAERVPLRQVGRAVLASEAEDLEAAAKEFSEAVASYPHLPNLHYTYGVFLLKVRPEEAIEQFQQELQRDPNHLGSLLQLAIEYLRRAEVEKARHYALRALEVEPASPAAHHAMGRILLQTGDVEGAIRHGELGAALAPDRPEMHFFLAQAYARAGRTADVERERKLYEELQRRMQKP
ncbi:MAG: hypothetical protein Kow00109_26390 [Acidobacteriota bacterium]